MTSNATLHRPPRHPWLILGCLVASQVAVAALWWQWGWRWGLPAMIATHLAVVACTLYPRATLLCPALARLPVAGRRVWLTIDDGPSDDTLPLLDLLDRHGARATFFVVGARARARPELVREIVRRGHGLGNHSDGHRDRIFWMLGPWRMAREIGECQRTLQDITGAAPRWFRSVVGMTNPFVALPLHRLGLTRVAWSARGFDGVDCEPAQVLDRITGDIAPGAIVLLHEGAKHGHNVAIAAALLQWMVAHGWQSVLPEQLEAERLGAVSGRMVQEG